MNLDLSSKITQFISREFFDSIIYIYISQCCWTIYIIIPMIFLFNFFHPKFENFPTNAITYSSRLSHISILFHHFTIIYIPLTSDSIMNRLFQKKSVLISAAIPLKQPIYDWIKCPSFQKRSYGLNTLLSWIFQYVTIS